MIREGGFCSARKLWDWVEIGWTVFDKRALGWYAVDDGGAA